MAPQSTLRAQNPTGRENLINIVDTFSNLLSPAERNALSQTETPGDILTALKQAKVSEKNIKNCEAFLQSVQQFSSIIDTMIQHNPFISALVWGSIKILLMTAQNYIQYFSYLADFLGKLGTICPIYKEFQALWPHHEGLQDAVFESGTSRILRAPVRPVNNGLQDVEMKLLLQQKIVEYHVELAREASAKKAMRRQMLLNSNRETHREGELQERIRNRQWRQSLQASAKGFGESSTFSLVYSRD
ncbi:hypothetical protein BDZ91DRAFT_814006 [Kalaharituber pfeilii]|nr:hypothetical protein BDZ91DRAFT_814006 [Kalaharituber pfeilii]